LQDSKEFSPWKLEIGKRETEKRQKNQMARQQDRRLIENKSLSESSAFDPTRQPPRE